MSASIWIVIRINKCHEESYLRKQKQLKIVGKAIVAKRKIRKGRDVGNHFIR